MVSVQHLLDQCRQRTTIVLGNLGRWPDRVTYYEPDYPYTILLNPILGCIFLGRLENGDCVYESFGFDSTGVELRFFQVGRFSSHRVWEAYQPHMTDAYSVDLTDCPRSRRTCTEMVDVVGRLGNASRRSCALAHRGSSTLKRAFGTPRAALA
ncbi:hypothetical protein TNCV_3026541 [Trichonephila clavipes]|nr:hypothetical protein TNCV_3026541 [Trichonephila clavipes]